MTIVRPPMVYGPDCPGNFALLKKLALRTPVFPLVENRRSMIYIDNLVYALKDISDKKLSGIILPMDKEYVNTSDMVYKIAHAAGKRLLLSRALGRVVSIIPLGITKKVFGSLCYDKDSAMLCDHVSLEKAIEQCLANKKGCCE